MKDPVLCPYLTLRGSVKHGQNTERKMKSP
jgi:hypothetical protein